MGDEEKRIGVGLALSGGGYRAALFHVGSLWRLNELGYLPKFCRVASVSGGSITAAVLGLRWKQLEYEGNVASNFTDLIAGPIWSFCSITIDIPTIVYGVLTPFRNPGHFLARKYAEILFDEHTLQDLPSDEEGPRFIIYATNMQTGTNLRFSRPYISDYQLGWKLDNPDTKISLAVAASSAFPPFFTPVVLRTNLADWSLWKKKDRYLANRNILDKILLTDGGVYDNMGLETIWKRCHTVLVSAAGAPFEIQRKSFLTEHSTLAATRRVLDITIEQCRDLRRRMLYKGYKLEFFNGAYWNIASSMKKYDQIDTMVEDNAVTKSMARISTRLKKLPDRTKGRLINWGYAITDAAMRRWLEKQAPKPQCWPVPDYPLDHLDG